MVSVSVDTNIWISLQRLDALSYVFQLDYQYLMESSAARDELLSPADLLEKVRDLGLVEIELTDEELLLVLEYQRKNAYPRLSTYDLFALAIAKNRKIMLLTGDGPLRKAAEEENVVHHGLLWIIVECAHAGIIDNHQKNQLFDIIEQNLSQYRLKKEDVNRARDM